eukprot:7322112-Pyramimonas_sp.AAC.1
MRQLHSSIVEDVTIAVGKQRSEEHHGQAPQKEGHWLLGKWAGLDLRSIAATRVAISSILLLDLAIRASMLPEMHCDDYLIPNGLNQHGWIVHRVLFHRGSVPFQVVVAVVQAASLIAFLGGFRTRVTSVL